MAAGSIAYSGGWEREGGGGLNLAFSSTLSYKMVPSRILSLRFPNCPSFSPIPPLPSAGPFTPVYRSQLNHEWIAELGARNVPATEGTNLIKTLQDPVKVDAGGAGGEGGTGGESHKERC